MPAAAPAVAVSWVAGSGDLCPTAPRHLRRVTLRWFLFFRAKPGTEGKHRHTKCVDFHFSVFVGVLEAEMSGKLETRKTSYSLSMGRWPLDWFRKNNGTWLRYKWEALGDKSRTSIDCDWWLLVSCCSLGQGILQCEICSCSQIESKTQKKIREDPENCQLDHSTNPSHLKLQNPSRHA